MVFLDIIKLNHWLNARKLTLNFFKDKNNSLYKKLKKNKNFKSTDREIKILCNNLNVDKNDLMFEKELPEFIFHYNSPFIFIS